MIARPRRDVSLFSARSRRYAALLVSVLVIISAVALSMAPRWLVPHLAARFPGCLYAVETTAQAVALTIDDGPDPLTTPDLLRELRNHGAHATFFLISGNVADVDSTVAAMIAAGHEIGNHLTRDQASISLAPAAFDSAIVVAGRTLSRFGPVRWARP